MGSLKLGHLKLEMKWLRRSVLCVRASLGKTKSLGFIFSIFVGNCLCNKLSFFFKGILFPDESWVSRPLVVCWIISGEQQGDWSFEAGPLGTKAKDLQPPRITWKDILGNATSCTCGVHERVSASERACFSANDRVLRVQICIRPSPPPRIILKERGKEFADPCFSSLITVPQREDETPPYTYLPVTVPLKLELWGNVHAVSEQNTVIGLLCHCLNKEWQHHLQSSL